MDAPQHNLQQEQISNIPASDLNLVPETKIAILIVAFNNLAYTKITLDSVFKYTTVPYKVFFVDNGSSDGTLEYVREFKEVEVIRSNENLGFSGGNNLALRKIQNNFVNKARVLWFKYEHNTHTLSHLLRSPLNLYKIEIRHVKICL